MLHFRWMRKTEKAIGNVTYELTEKVKASRKFSRSLFVVKDIKSGEFFTRENIRSIRPGYGLNPKHYKDIIGKRANTNLGVGTPLNYNYII